MAAHWTWPTRRSMQTPSGGPVRVGAAAPIRKCVSYRWWEMARMCCSAAKWMLTPQVKSRCRKLYWQAYAKACFVGYELWKQARASGADLLWRVKKNMRLACEKRLPDGSYLSRIYPSERDWRHKANGLV